jgi:Ca2+-binding RTX toxin-like protein
MLLFCISLFVISDVWAEIIVASPSRGNAPNINYLHPNGAESTLVSWGAFRGQYTKGITRMATGDVDGNGTTDIVLIDPVTLSDGTSVPLTFMNIRIYDGTGNTRYAFRFDDPHVVEGLEVAVGDVDDDRRGEIVIASDSSVPGNNVFVLKVLDSGRLQEYQSYRSYFVPGKTKLGLGDVDRNDHVDVVLADPFRLADGQRIPRRHQNLRVIDVSTGSHFSTRLADDRFIEQGGFAVANIDGILGAEIIIAGDSHRISGENISIWRLMTNRHPQRRHGFRGYFSAGTTILAVGNASRTGGKQIVLAEPFRLADGQEIASDHNNVRLYNSSGHEYAFRHEDPGFVAGSGIAVGWIVGPDYTYIGTEDADEIYFGQCASCRYPWLLVCRKTGNRIDRKELPLGRGTLKIDGRGGNDYIQAVHKSERFTRDERLNCDFGDFNALPFAVVEIIGSSGNDCLIGSEGTQTLRGDRGNDYLSGYAGNDSLYGGHGNDYLVGDQGNDELRGEEGNDILQGGTGRDLIDGGRGRDTFRCRFAATPNPDYDGTDHPTDCQDQVPFYPVGIENQERRDPYQQWAFLTYCRNGTIHHHLTTSNQQLLLRDRAAGANLLLESGGTLRAVEHKQYPDTCGPASLNIVMEHMGLANHSSVASEPRDLDGGGTDTVDLGYHLSQEHIMHLCYQHFRQGNQEGWSDAMAQFMDGDGLLDITLPNTNSSKSDAGFGDFYEIRYDLGNNSRNVRYTPPTNTTTGQVDNWILHGKACGDSGLIHVAEQFPYGPRIDVRSVSTAYGAGRDFVSLEHLQAVIRGFIDAGIPIVVGMESGGHFNTLIGYWNNTDGFWIYTADPLDGWGRPFYAKPMRWRKIRLNDDALPNGADVVVSMILYGHGTGCRHGGWAANIDRRFGSSLLCP